MEGMIGEVRLFAGNFAPRTWAFCDGQLLPISQNTALFSIIGTIYGGDGRTTFALPDLRGRTAMGAGRGPGLSDRRLGAKGGIEKVTLNMTNMPTHGHNNGTAHVVASDSPTGGSTPSNAAILNRNFAADTQPTTSLATGSVIVDQSQPTGGNQPHNNMQPSLGLYYIIALQGVFPSRS